MGFGLIGAGRRTIRQPVNPLDKSTIVSIYPKAIEETHHTIMPGVFKIPAGSYAKPSILVVGTSSWWRDIDEEQPLLEIPVSSVVIAKGVIDCYSNGMIAYTPGESAPGLFFVPGEKTVAEIQMFHSAEIDKAAEIQKKWFAELIKLADKDWARSNRNPIAVSDQARMAAHELQIQNREWLQDFSALLMTNCPACGTLRNNNYPICGNCKTILDQTKYKELGLQQAS